MPTVENLRRIAKGRGLTGYSKMKKANLMSLLGNIASTLPKVKSPTVNRLRERAKRLGFTGYSKMKKANLKQMLFGKPKTPVKLNMYNLFGTPLNLSPVPTPVGSPNYVSPLGLSGISPTPSLPVSNKNIVNYMKKYNGRTTIKKVAEHFGVTRKRVRNLYEVTYVTPSPPKKSPTVKNLRNQAKRLGLTGYSKLKKANLQRLLYVYNPNTNRFKTFGQLISST